VSHPIIRMHSDTDVSLLSPTPDVIHIRDIAHHLALINRFNGATETPYSVAQHSVLVADLLLAKKQPAHVCLWGLLHDAHEAYLGDLTTPVKYALFGMWPVPSSWDAAMLPLDAAILRKFRLELSAVELREVALADVTALATEWRDLMPGKLPDVAAKPAPQRVTPLAWHRAEEMFLRTYDTLARHLNLPKS
jgi:uncharacterized protein